MPWTHPPQPRRVLFGSFFARAASISFAAGAEMPPEFFLLLLVRLSGKYLYICVGLREIVEAESLGKLELAPAFRIGFTNCRCALDFRGRTLPAAAEILVRIRS